MTRLHLHPERHLVSRNGWLRVAVLGANDGIVSTASLIIGVAAIAAHAGGAPVWAATMRFTFWGALAMALTAGIGRLVGTVV
jgi:VIT1/CCC1 family predicted Fe2+/Mn2+ transporter